MSLLYMYDYIPRPLHVPRHEEICPTAIRDQFLDNKKKKESSRAERIKKKGGQERDDACMI